MDIPDLGIRKIRHVLASVLFLALCLAIVWSCLAVLPRVCSLLGIWSVNLISSAGGGWIRSPGNFASTGPLSTDTLSARLSSNCPGCGRLAEADADPVYL